MFAAKSFRKTGPFSFKKSHLSAYSSVRSSAISVSYTHLEHKCASADTLHSPVNPHKADRQTAGSGLYALRLSMTLRYKHFYQSSSIVSPISKNRERCHHTVIILCIPKFKGCQSRSDRIHSIKNLYKACILCHHGAKDFPVSVR